MMCFPVHPRSAVITTATWKSEFRSKVPLPWLKWTGAIKHKRCQITARQTSRIMQAPFNKLNVHTLKLRIQRMAGYGRRSVQTSQIHFRGKVRVFIT
nr:hypothetical protein [Human betaherpesvirus 6]